MVGVRTVESSLEQLPDRPVLSSRGRPWGQTITVDLHRAQKNFEQDLPPLDHHFVACILHGGGRLYQDRGGRKHASVLRADSTLIMPAGQKARWWGEQPQNLRFRIPAAYLEDAWAQLGTLPGRASELHSIYSARDTTLHGLAQLFLEECKSPNHPAQRLILESASCMVAAHLVRTYCTFGGHSPARRMRLTPRAVEAVAAYVEDNLRSPIRLDDLASLAGVSRYHFCRSYQETTGMSPMRFVEKARMRRAQELIRLGKLTIRQISRLVGYTDASHFSRRFAAHTKCTPLEYASAHRGLLSWPVAQDGDAESIV